MSNPVVPPPANQGFGGPAQPEPGAQQGFGDAPAAPPAKKKSGLGRKALSVLVALVIGVGIFAAKSFFFGDKAKDAAVGDCISTPKDVGAGEETETAAKVVDCGSGDADYTVLGRINGETNVDSKSCDKHFTVEDASYVVLASRTGGGYLLCLQEKK